LIPVAEDPTYPALKNHLIKTTGLAFYASRDKELTELIGQRLSTLELRDCSSYAEFLKGNESGQAEMEVIIAQLTIGETSFFRDPAQFQAITEVVLPDILERNRFSRKLRIWSAGCATGAEPYSLAILLAREFQDRLAGWQVSIYGTDLNRAFLARAEEGKFRAWALRSTSDEVTSECFTNEGRLWTIRPEYKQCVSFHQMNLVDSEFSTSWAEDANFDLILCRNVMIYFSPEMNRRLVGRLYHALDHQGWLIVGATEHNLENYKSFATVIASGTKLYQKAAVDAVVAVELVEAVAIRAAAAPLAAPQAESSHGSVEGLLQLADSGDWQKAAEYGQRLLAKDRLNPEIHFYLGLIFENLGIRTESERSLRQAIYVDRNFALAHYHLGLALQRDGRMPAAARSFGNVLKVLAGMPDEAMVPAGVGLTVLGLKGLTKMHLDISRGS
jgi:chemotaxis protein methyltransferase CheR